MARRRSYGQSTSPFSSFFLVLLLALSCCRFDICCGLGKFGFDIHHRFSDRVKRILTLDQLPEKGTIAYYVAMAHRDRVIHGRRLASRNHQPVTFGAGNDTFRISSLGYLHYANVSVGTPSLSFLVALDTGSDLFWLPCDCSSCVHSLVSTVGDRIELNIYSPNSSASSTKVHCNSTLCELQNRCPSAGSNCPYQVIYLSNGTSSTGTLVEDALHLITDDAQEKEIDAPITLGCGQVQTGSFLEGAAPNGLFGLGMDSISVPSTLARKGFALNSFSMCFGSDGIGRISFGDKGSSDQRETPFHVRQKHPTYNISITQISVAEVVANVSFSAIFDSGTSFSYLNDPAYTSISESFNALTGYKKYVSDSEFPFKYCYEIDSEQTTIGHPSLNLTMHGGDQFLVTDPLVIVSTQDVGHIYCLGIVKSGDVNIIGQNFMTGYRLVFDREKMVLGWKASNCYDANGNSSTTPISSSHGFTTVPPAEAVNPEATAAGSGTPPTVQNNSPWLTSTIFVAMLPLLSFFSIS